MPRRSVQRRHVSPEALLRANDERLSGGSVVEQPHMSEIATAGQALLLAESDESRTDRRRLYR